ncbi:hypothetical protein J6590_082098 [Homalodisca vitripennis]|nr:hypothetical protein J6590_082098 [Homalodisca vitripennis]
MGLPIYSLIRYCLENRPNLKDLCKDICRPHPVTKDEDINKEARPYLSVQITLYIGHSTCPLYWAVAVIHWSDRHNSQLNSTYYIFIELTWWQTYHELHQSPVSRLFEPLPVPHDEDEGLDFEGLQG